jgi:succinate dehydrogenase / fumarate reductase cytochrome b subunit
VIVDNKNKRPKFLNPLAIHLPVGAWVSILHRLTGLGLVVLLPAGLYVLDQSLRSPVFFENLRQGLAALPGRLLLLVVVWIAAQHLFAGIRHLLLDVDIGVDLKSARRSAWATLAASLAVTALIGVWL